MNRIVDATFAKSQDGLAEVLGPGLYGPSLFDRSVGTLNLLNACNHLTAVSSDAAGVPTSPILATVPSGLVLARR